MKKDRRGLSFYQKNSKVNKKLFTTIGEFIFLAFAAGLLAFVFVFCFGIKTSVIGSSMEPTLYSSEEIFINRFVYFMSDPNRGDVVVFLPNGNPNSHYFVKRVIGVPGDTVLIDNGIIYVNGEIYEENRFYDKIENPGIAENMITLMEDEYFVLGDNRNNSEDSRSSNIGMVRKEYIVGRAWFHLTSKRQNAGLIK